MEYVLAVAAIVAVFGVLMVRRRQRRSGPPPPELVAVPDDLVVYEGSDGNTLLLEPLSERPEGASPVPAAVASQLVHEASKLSPQLRQALQGGSKQLYRLVHSPPGGLHQVAGDPSLVRGFGYQGGQISGQGAFKRVPSASVTPALALTAASAVLGAYWQQQIDDKLRGIQTTLDGIRARLDAELDAKLDLAERTLAEHEAAPPDGHYEPPSSITDGLQANLVERRELHRLLAKLEPLEGSRLRHRDYHAKVLAVDGEHLDVHIYRALRGLSIELRVLRLKRLGGLIEPDAYRDILDRQEHELRDQLQMVEQLLGMALGIRGSKRADTRRAELPSQRRARQNRELKKSKAGRRRLSELSNVTGQLTAVLPPAELTDGSLELVLEFDGDRAAAYALPSPDPAAGERADS